MRHGCGDIQERGGRFRVRAYVDGSRRSLGTYATEDDAKRILDGLAQLHVSGQASRSSTRTFLAYGATWLDRREQTGVACVDSERSRWKRYIAGEEWATLPIDEITRRDVREWLDRLARSNSARGTRVSPQTVVHCLHLVGGIFVSAIEDELVTKNVATGHRITHPKSGPGQWTYLTPEEQGRLATCGFTGSPSFVRRAEAERYIALFALGTGLRQSEVWRLRDVDIDADSSTPHVVVLESKSGRPRRVPLFGLALTAWRDWLELRPAYAPETHGLAFPTPRGCMREASKTPRTWPALLVTARLTPSRRHDGRHVRWHDLRHSCASALVAGWWGRTWTLQEVCAVLGHSSVTVTERYAHLAPSVLDAAARLTGPRMGPSLTLVGSKTPRITERARRDSNARPSASEAEATSNEIERLRALWSRLGPIAERYLRAVEIRSRHAHRHAIELAELVLEESERRIALPASRASSDHE